MPQLEQVFTPDMAANMGFTLISVCHAYDLPFFVYVKVAPFSTIYCVTINHTVIGLLDLPEKMSGQERKDILVI